MTIEEALRNAPLDAREARLLLAAATGFSEASVLAYPERQLPVEAQERFQDFVRRRKTGEPVAYILGRKEFYGIELAVNPAVLIPRPETELLVELALQRGFSSVVDLGTGCGAIRDDSRSTATAPTEWRATDAGSRQPLQRVASACGADHTHKHVLERLLRVADLGHILFQNDLALVNDRHAVA